MDYFSVIAGVRIGKQMNFCLQKGHSLIPETYRYFFIKNVTSFWPSGNAFNDISTTTFIFWKGSFSNVDTPDQIFENITSHKSVQHYSVQVAKNVESRSKSHILRSSFFTCLSFHRYYCRIVVSVFLLKYNCTLASQIFFPL